MEEKQTFTFKRPLNDKMETCFNAFKTENDEKIDLRAFENICKCLFKNESNSYVLEASKTQEIFDVFDKDKDGFLDMNEFQFCWKHWIKVIVEPKSAFLIVDVQNDFISGNLSVFKDPEKRDGKEIIDPINQLLQTVKFDAVIYSLDWHPEDHISFVENVTRYDIHSKCLINAQSAKIYDCVTFKGPPEMEQILWPKHCIQGTWGSELHPDLKVVEDGIKIYKGINSKVDSYSAFWDNGKIHETNLNNELRSRNITDVYVCGLALDICVGYTTLDALNYGYRTVMVENCSKDISLVGAENMKEKIINNNGIIVKSDQVEAMVNGTDRRPELGYKLAMELKK